METGAAAKTVFYARDCADRPWQRRRIHFNWTLWYRCNYRCSYCWFEMDKAWESVARQYPCAPAEKWLETWGRVYERYGAATIGVVGGEPLLYPGVIGLFRGMAQWHYLELITNLFVSLKTLEELASQVSPEHLKISGSYHHQFAKWEEFLAKILLLKERGFDPQVNMVSWPPLLGVIREKVEILSSLGVRHHVLAFQGMHEGRDYPRSYSEEERRVLGEFIPDEERGYRTHETKTLGRLCGSGYVHAIVQANGEVSRCGKDGRYAKPMGNLLDPDFRLDGGPRPCPYNYCDSCGEHAFLWENWREESVPAVPASPLR